MSKNLLVGDLLIAPLNLSQASSQVSCRYEVIKSIVQGSNQQLSWNVSGVCGGEREWSLTLNSKACCSTLNQEGIDENKEIIYIVVL